MLYYCKTAQGNFGDDLNPWLWSRLAPELCDDQSPALFVGIGTLLGHKVPAEPIKVVLGAGCGYGQPPAIDRKWFFYGVRGPLTAAKLNLDPALVLTDPAILVRRAPLEVQKKVHLVSFMPHHQSMLMADWAALCAQAALHCIDPRGPVDRVLSEIQQTELLLAEAMHGAIVADALRVPWIPVRMYSQFLEFKWRDWTASVQVPLILASVPPVFTQEPSWGKGLVHAMKKSAARTGLGKLKWNRLPVRASNGREISHCLRALARLSRDHAPSLSADPVLQQVENRLVERLSELREAWRSGEFTAA